MSTAFDDRTNRSASARERSRALDAAAGLLNSARAVTILAASGTDAIREPLMELACVLQAPIAHRDGDGDETRCGNPYDVGSIGWRRMAVGDEALMDADVLVVICEPVGCGDIPVRARPVIHIHRQSCGPARAVGVDLHGGVAEAIEDLLPRLVQRFDKSHLTRWLSKYADEKQVWAGRMTGLDVDFVIAELGRLAEHEAVFVVDAGIPLSSIARDRRCIQEDRGPTLRSLRSAIGAQTIDLDRQVIAVVGSDDRRALLCAVELLGTSRLPVKLVVLDSTGLTFSAEDLAGRRHPSGPDLPDLTDEALFHGVFARRVERAEDLEDALLDAFDCAGPAVLDLVVA